MKYIFGPVFSRRLGYSLGIDIIPFKTCNFNCIYCECGRTTNHTMEIKPYVRTEEIINELKEVLKQERVIDYITFSGGGEPLLNSEIGKMIKKIKEITDKKIAVLTNGSLLYIPDVRKRILNADIVLPSLDAATQRTFERINRPVKGMKISKIIEGLTKFREEYKGRILLEILFIEGINDTQEELHALKKAVINIGPDEIHINMLDRPPAEEGIKSPPDKKIKEIYNFFKLTNIKTVIVGYTTEEKQKLIEVSGDIKTQIINFLKRRPETVENLSKGLGFSSVEMIKILSEIEKEGKIKSVILNGKTFYRLNVD